MPLNKSGIWVVIGIGTAIVAAGGGYLYWAACPPQDPLEDFLAGRTPGKTHFNTSGWLSTEETCWYVLPAYTEDDIRVAHYFRDLPSEHFDPAVGVRLEAWQIMPDGSIRYVANYSRWPFRHHLCYHLARAYAIDHAERPPGATAGNFILRRESYRSE